MEAYDTEKAARVWQRVLNNTPADTHRQSLQELLAKKQINAVAYSNLAHRLQGKASVTLRRLADEAHSHFACLQGICMIAEGHKLTVKTAPPAVLSAEALLRQCYGIERQCLTALEAHSSHPEYGPVYAHLAMQSAVHCRMILELLGNLQK